MGQLRLEPVGKDRMGNCYWYQVDQDASLRVYREDLEEETWELVAENREELMMMIEKLTTEDTYTRAEKILEEPEIEEDSLQGYEDIIRDTGVYESNTTSINASRVNSDDEDSRASSGPEAPQVPLKLRIKNLANEEGEEIKDEEKMDVEEGVKKEEDEALKKKLDDMKRTVELAKRMAEESAKKQAEEEASAKKKDEQKRKIEEEKAEKEAADKKRAEELAVKEQEEMKKKIEEETARINAEKAATAKKKADEEAAARKKAEYEMEWKKAEEEAARKRTEE